MGQQEFNTAEGGAVAPNATALDASRLRTEPLTLLQLASYFSVGRRAIHGVLKAIPGAERSGRGFWRIPIQDMPPDYLTGHGLLLPATIRPTESMRPKPPTKFDQKGA
jgi:hypothetical protein